MQRWQLLKRERQARRDGSSKGAVSNVEGLCLGDAQLLCASLAGRRLAHRQRACLQQSCHGELRNPSKGLQGSEAFFGAFPILSQKREGGELAYVSRRLRGARWDRSRCRSRFRDGYGSLDFKGG